MQLFQNNAKLILILAISTLFFVSVSADEKWVMKSVDEPFSMNNTGVNTTTIQVVNLTYDDGDTNDLHPLTEDLLDAETKEDLNYFYNKTKGSENQLEHLYNGFWYAEFQPKLYKGNTTYFTASGITKPLQDGGDGVASGSLQKVTENLNLSEFKIQASTGSNDVDLQNSIIRQKNGKKFKLEASILNTTQQNDYMNKSEGSVKAFFANASGKVKEFDLGLYNQQGNYFYNSEVKFPPQTNSSYILQIKATPNSGKNITTYSKIAKTLPKLRGQINKLNAQKGCKTTEMVERCQQGSQVSIHYNITSSTAQNVNLTTYAYNNSGKHKLKQKELNKQSNTEFNGTIQIPDINTSKYENKIGLEFNASDGNLDHVDQENISLETFKIQHTPSATSLGKEYKSQIFLGKPYTPTSYNKTRFKHINVSIIDSESNQVDNYTIDEIKYNQNTGLMHHTTVIDSEHPTGTYTLNVTATNLYGETKNKELKFTVRELETPFEVDRNQKWQIYNSEDAMFPINISNLLQTELEIEANITEGKGKISIENQTINISADSEEDIHIQTNITDLSKDHTAQINLKDNNSEYNQTVDITIETTDCKIIAGQLCTTTQKINTKLNVTEEKTKKINLIYMNKTGSLTYNSSIEGNITNHLNLSNQNTVTEITDQKEIEINFKPNQPGNYTGNLTFNTSEEKTLKLPINMTVELNETQETAPPSITINPQTLDLGTVIQGETINEEITITNSGESNIESISTTSNSYTISAESISIDTNQSKTVTLSIGDIADSTGEATITAENEAGQTTQSIQISASPIQDYSEKALDLNTRLTELQSSAPSKYDADLTNARTKIQNIQTEWEAGNYDEAKSTYQEVDSTLQTISSETSNSQTPTQPETEPQGENPGEQNPSNGSILPLLIAIISIVLVAGFIFYTSYIPEKGDPLYSVLGENQ